MKILNLVKSEFKKNFSIKKLILSLLVLFISCYLLADLAVPDDSIFGGSYDEFLVSSERMEKWESEGKRSKFPLIMAKTRADLIKKLRENNIPESRWNISAIFEVSTIVGDNYLIEQLKNKDEELKKVCENDASESYYGKNFYNYCNSTVEELDKIYNDNEEIISNYEKILLKDKYYQYIQYEIELGKREKNKFTDLIIEKKIEKEDYRVLNYLVYTSINLNRAARQDGTEEWKQKIEQDNYQMKEILFYSSEHEIKHDLNYNEFNGLINFTEYANPKRIVNQVYHLSFIIMFLISIMYGGIVSNEHHKGTIKNMISAPVRRWKILASKFIYLILNTYILWFIGLIIFSIIAGIEYGFSDLFTPKLIYSGSKVIEVNYYLYTIKNIFLASIPVICFLSILFMLSTLTLNTSITVGISSVISVLAPVLFLFKFNTHFKEIVYTPLWYFDLGFILNDDFHYIESLIKYFYHWEYGILISLIVGIILYVLTTLIYSKKDIKN